MPLGTSSFTLPTKIASGGAYTVAIQQQPTDLACQLVNATGTISAAAITNIQVVCGQWSWQSGANTTGAAGVYGMQGMAAADNVPGARESAASWMDHAGNLWLFGGTDYDSARTRGALNDLWQYNLAAGQWIWMSGSQTTGAPGSYGTEAVAAPGNTPGERFAPIAWVDGSGDFWLFGGKGWVAAKTTGLLNDLWEFAQ